LYSIEAKNPKKKKKKNKNKKTQNLCGNSLQRKAKEKGKIGEAQGFSEGSSASGHPTSLFRISPHPFHLGAGRPEKKVGSISTVKTSPEPRLRTLCLHFVSFNGCDDFRMQHVVRLLMTGQTPDVSCGGGAKHVGNSTII
jgi:hypothetical protein